METMVRNIINGERTCQYCGKVMKFIGSERIVKKRWTKKGMTTAKKLKKTDHPLYLCPDIECGGIFIEEGIRTIDIRKKEDFNKPFTPIFAFPLYKEE
jgi:hypothetical protein